MTFSTVGLGGTFDHFHIGHQSFINFAAKLGEHLIIGVTNQRMVEQKEFPQTIQDYDTRFSNLEKFCKENKINAQLVELTDPYGPTVEPDSLIEAIAVTTATQGGAEMINRVRHARGLEKLPVHVHQLLEDSRGIPINSTRIRAGEISRDGQYWLDSLAGGMKLTDAQREIFSQPQGKIFTHQQIGQEMTDPDQNFRNLRFLAGDFTLQIFNKNHWGFDLAIFDRKVRRESVNDPSYLNWLDSVRPIAQLPNQSGEISQEVFHFLDHWDDIGLSKTGSEKAQKKLIEIFGEEDLVTVPLVLRAPLGTEIYYGQPDIGLVKIMVSEEVKQKFVNILEQK